ncbi:unnamed protein product [Ambrosiozyma monospora]|uniref:Unnamed protein product n=1 Tax=Ambrosiozyma monospora TaxID=43982 RepID=A0ACB5T0U2_AMBMO|nr:unnamed protein product [Ambrosiozyma monospora]
MCSRHNHQLILNLLRDGQDAIQKRLGNDDKKEETPEPGVKSDASAPVDASESPKKDVTAKDSPETK